MFNFLAFKSKIQKFEKFLKFRKHFYLDYNNHKISILTLSDRDKIPWGAFLWWRDFTLQAVPAWFKIFALKLRYLSAITLYKFILFSLFRYWSSTWCLLWSSFDRNFRKDLFIMFVYNCVKTWRKASYWIATRFIENCLQILYNYTQN